MFPRTPSIFPLLFPAVLFRVKTDQKQVFLTFDDGPHPDITPFVLDCLATFHAKATFFAVGENSEKYPHIIERIKNDGHAIGHHTQNHLNAFLVPYIEYVENVQKGAESTPSTLFRPPYGKLTPRVYRRLKKKYRIVLWDVLAEDYVEKYSAKECIQKVLRQVRPGSVVVLHDNPKCSHKVEEILPQILKKLQERGYRFLPIMP